MNRVRVPPYAGIRLTRVSSVFTGAAYSKPSRYTGSTGAISGLGTAATSVVLASEVFNMQGFRPPAFGLAVVAVASALLVMLAGLLGTRRIARTPPMLVLRRGN